MNWFRLKIKLNEILCIIFMSHPKLRLILLVLFVLVFNNCPGTLVLVSPLIFCPNCCLVV